MPATPLNRICYVEDDEDIQRIVRLSLEKVGKMTVEVVSDPLVAIERITAFKPELVMLDWMMPGLDGPALFRKMREVAETKDLPVVFITAKASQRELDELRTMGALGTISKPFSPKDLPDQLRALWHALP
jgi:two-component system OmpR family response regulator